MIFKGSFSLYSYWMVSMIFQDIFMFVHGFEWFCRFSRYFHGFLIVWGLFLCFCFKLVLWFSLFCLFSMVVMVFMVFSWFPWYFKVVFGFGGVFMAFQGFQGSFIVFGWFPWFFRFFLWFL